MSQQTIHKPKAAKNKVSSDIEQELLAGKRFKKKNKQYNSDFRPCLACTVNVDRNYITLSQNGHDFAYRVNEQLSKSLQHFFSLLDGTKTLEELQQIFSPNRPQVVETIVQDLDEQGLLDRTIKLNINSGNNTLKQLEDLTHNLLNNSQNNNTFWQSINSTKSDLPVNVLHGYVLEQYHFSLHKSSFCSPALNYPCSGEIQQLTDRMYCQELAQEKLLLKALNIIGFSNKDVADIIPLSATAAMYRTLGYWANSEPLFFFYLMEIIKQRRSQNWLACLKACERTEIDPLFLVAVKKLARFNRENKQQSLTNSLFQEIYHLDEKTKQRFRGQIYLFVELYSYFHTAIWNYYSSTNNSQRRISLI